MPPISTYPRPPILIAGPTASGKSALATALAEAFGGAVINADSLQVYRELRILTARPSEADEARVPHLLYGHVPAREAYSAGRFVTEAAHAIADVRRRGLIPIVIGGTGLYFQALLEGLSPVPPVPADVRKHWRGEAIRLGAEALHAVLAERDPRMAVRLRPSDPQRVTRALEVLEASGRSLLDWQSQAGEPVLDAGRVLKLVVCPSREVLNRRCDERFDLMMAHGALDEIRALAALKLDPGLPAMKALGVEPLIQLCEGAIAIDDAVTRAKAATRQYVKRQVTWAKGNMSAWRWLSEQEIESFGSKNFYFIYSSP